MATLLQKSGSKILQQFLWRLDEFDRSLTLPPGCLINRTISLPYPTNLLILVKAAPILQTCLSDTLLIEAFAEQRKIPETVLPKKTLWDRERFISTMNDAQIEISDFWAFIQETKTYQGSEDSRLFLKSLVNPCLRLWRSQKGFCDNLQTYKPSLHDPKPHTAAVEAPEMKTDDVSFDSFFEKIRKESTVSSLDKPLCIFHHYYWEMSQKQLGETVSWCVSYILSPNHMTQPDAEKCLDLIRRAFIQTAPSEEQIDRWCKRIIEALPKNLDSIKGACLSGFIGVLLNHLNTRQSILLMESMKNALCRSNLPFQQEHFANCISLLLGKGVDCVLPKVDAPSNAYVLVQTLSLWNTVKPHTESSGSQHTIQPYRNGC